MFIGDFAVVELFATKYPVTKKQKNRTGLTALQIAQKEGFKRIAQILEFGDTSHDFLITDEKISATSKHSYQVLETACRNGQAKIIKEFCQERYDSRDEKKSLCCKLIGIAKSYHQEEIADILQLHYDRQLKMDIPSDIELEKIVTLDAKYKNILNGVLEGLHNTITGISADLDPADPGTFINLFSKLVTNLQQSAQELENADTKKNIRKLIRKDMSGTEEKLEAIDKRLNQVEEYNTMLKKSIQKTDKRLSSVTGLTAVPFGSILKPIKTFTNFFVGKLNEREQKREFYNISTLGNIEELQRVASDTAALLTLYYKQQIESIDALTKIKSSNFLTQKVHALKENFLDFHPEKKDEKAVIIVALYVINWLIETLKTAKGREIVSNIPLSEQLWYYVAKNDPFVTKTIEYLTDIAGYSDGRQLIPLQKKDPNGRKYQVKLQHLIGYPSVVSKDGLIYQYPVSPQDFQKDNYPDLTIFGYVYLEPFTTDREICRSIIKERHLISAQRSVSADTRTKIAEIERMSMGIKGENSGIRPAVMSDTAFEVAKVLREQKSFADSSYVHKEIKKSGINIECRIENLQNSLQENDMRYQTSMEAAHDFVKLESDRALTALIKENKQRFDDGLRKQTEQMLELQKQLESKNKHYIKEIEKHLQSENKQYMEQVQKQLETQDVNRMEQIQKQSESQSKHHIKQIQKHLQSENKQYMEQVQKQLETQNVNRIEQTQKQIEFQLQNLTNEISKHSKAELNTKEPKLKQHKPGLHHTAAKPQKSNQPHAIVEATINHGETERKQLTSQLQAPSHNMQQQITGQSSTVNKILSVANDKYPPENEESFDYPTRF
ncbi:unnamed protein product [Rotaria socialis]|uniref:Ankyrin repeat protein n=1 Tax=Rotaria socialis TaxID=392032 RepID=A0A821KWB1_9BILA|nr:unnamed protein product [Rotaria socialis]